MSPILGQFCESNRKREKITLLVPKQEKNSVFTCLEFESMQFRDAGNMLNNISDKPSPG